MASSSVSSCTSTGSTTLRQHRRGGPKWELCPVPPQARLIALTDAERALLPLPPGFGVRFFSHDLRCLYTVASLHVLCTSGTLDFLAEFNAVGPQKTRSRLFLCTHYDRNGACPDGFGCREVHCELKTASATHVSPIYCATRSAAPAAAANGSSPLCDSCEAPTPSPMAKVHSQLTQPPPEPAKGELLCSAVHARTANSDAHPRLPPGVVFRLALPNMHQPIDEVPSDTIFETSGARAYFDHVRCGAPSAPPATNMQHCAHFSKNGLCCFGPDCQFVHVVGCAKFETLLAAAAADGKTVVAGSDASSLRPGLFAPRANTDGSASEVDDAPRSSVSSSAGRRGGGSTISSSSSAAGGAAAAAGRGGVPKSTPLSFDAASAVGVAPPTDFLPPSFLPPPPPAHALLSPGMFASAPPPLPVLQPPAFGAHPVALPPTAEHLALLQNLLAVQQQQQQQQQQQLLLAAAFVAQQQQQQTAAVTALAAALRNNNEAAATSLNQQQQQLLHQQLLHQLVLQQQQQQLALSSASYTLAPGTALPGGLVVRSVNGQLQFVPR